MPKPPPAEDTILALGRLQMRMLSNLLAVLTAKRMLTRAEAQWVASEALQAETPVDPIVQSLSMDLVRRLSHLPDDPPADVPSAV